MVFFCSLTAKVSLDRVSDFLNNTELLDQYTPNDAASAEAAVIIPPYRDDVIGIRAASFAWSNAYDVPISTTEHSRRHYTLRIDEELQFKRGKLNLIVGPTGSGKTSLLMALLGACGYDCCTMRTVGTD